MEHPRPTLVPGTELVPGVELDPEPELGPELEPNPEQALAPGLERNPEKMRLPAMAPVMASALAMLPKAMPALGRGTAQPPTQASVAGKRGRLPQWLAAARVGAWVQPPPLRDCLRISFGNWIVATSSSWQCRRKSCGVSSSVPAPWCSA